MQPFRKLTEEEIEKAWGIMSMHNSELLLTVNSLEKRNAKLEERARVLEWRIDELERDLYRAETYPKVSRILYKRIVYFFRRFK
jgi:3-dehydroquinate dehydratase